MFRGLFPRLFSYFREGGFLHGEWTATNGTGAIAAVGANTHNEVTLAFSSQGVYLLTFPPCQRAFIKCSLGIAGGAIATVATHALEESINPGLGTATIRMVGAATPVLSHPANGGSIRVMLYLGQGSP